jgi:uncharacterized protein YggE
MVTNQNLLLAGAFFMAGLFAHQSGVFASPPAIAAGTPAAVRQITVGGLGSVKVVPNIARISLAVMNTDVDLQQAVARTDATAARLLALKDKYKIENADVVTDGVSLQTHRRYGDEKPIKYDAVKRLTFKLHHPAQVQAFLSDAIAAGANQLGEEYGSSMVSFEAEDNVEADRKSREMALRSAQAKASEMAAALGCRIGSPRMIEEEYYSYAPHLQGATNGTIGPQGNDAGGIAVGRVSYDCNVKVSFDLI